jgi:hypothetical protein
MVCRAFFPPEALTAMVFNPFSDEASSFSVFAIQGPDGRIVCKDGRSLFSYWGLRNFRSAMLFTERTRAQDKARTLGGQAVEIVVQLSAAELQRVVM